jgi:hypothetical protein
MSVSYRLLHKKLFISTLFAIAMAYLESSVVVYLREIYYPDGFTFPLREISSSILLTEIGREAATIIMLFTYARTIGQNGREIFAYFSMNFGIWDIWYYLWLKILLDWPSSLLEWDILFLIPAPWVGPVLAPILISLALIGAAYTILRAEAQNKPLRLRPLDWILEAAAGLVIIGSFLNNPESIETLKLPAAYSWWIFSIGMGAGLFVFIRRVIQNRRI